MMAEPLNVTLELVRVDQSEGPDLRDGAQDYLVRSDDGTYAPARLVWNDALKTTVEQARERHPDAAQRLGETLRRFLAVTRFAAADAAIVAALRDRRPVRVELASNAGELFGLPWELLTLADGRHLGELPGVEVVYRWPGARAADDARPRAREGGRLLVAWSRAYGNVGEAPVLAAIEAATRALPGFFDRARDVVADATLPAIAAALAAGDPPTCLVILCHGAPGPGGYGLGLDDGRGGRHLVDAGSLRRALGAAAGHLRCVLILACDSGNAGEPGAHLGSVAHEVHRAGVAAVVAPRYPVRGAAALALARDVFEAMVHETCSFERAFQLARERALQAGGEVATFQLYTHSPAGARPIAVRPYRGLLAFEREHAALFFGRDAEIAEALSDLDARLKSGGPRALIVAGASGTGKSSLVLSPLRVALERRGDRVAVMRPGRTPRAALAAALRERPASGRLIVVVDQFEELFTHHVDAGGAAEAAAFARELWDLVSRTDDTVAAILTLRVDFVGRCGEIVVDAAGARLDRFVYDEAYRVFVPQMGPEALRAAIEGPAARVGLGLEAGLGEALVRQVSGESSALPLLSYVLDELWRRREGEVLTHAALTALGGVSGALSRHADGVVDRLDPAAQAQARRILVRLVMFGMDRSSGARRREAVAELRSTREPEAWDRAAAALEEARLLIRRSEGEPTLEIAHEALIRHWERLWTWYEADRDRLARRHELARLVAQYEREGALTDKAVTYGQELLTGLDPDDVLPRAWTMIADSAAAMRARQRRRRILIVSALAGLALFSTVSLTLFFRARRSAQDAREASKMAGSAARVAAASRVLVDKPHVAAALLRAQGDAIAASFGWNQAAFLVLHEPIPQITQLPADLKPQALALAADGSAVIVDDAGRVHWLPAGSGAPRELGAFPPAGSGEATHVRMAPRGDRFFLVRSETRGGQLQAWSIAEGAPTRRADVRFEGRFDELRVGGRSGDALLRVTHFRDVPGEPIPAGTEEHSLWSLTGERRAATACRLLDESAERSLCPRGPDALEILTWTGEPAGRVESPGIGAATPVLGGLQGALAADGGSTFAVWSWDAGGVPERRREVTLEFAQVPLELAVFPEHVVVLDHSGQGGSIVRLCTFDTPQDGSTPPPPACQRIPFDCMNLAQFGDTAMLACKDEVRVFTPDTLTLVRHLRGPDAGQRAVATDPRAEQAARDPATRTDVALVDSSGRAWRWLAPPSHLTTLDRRWASFEDYYVPRLQPGSDRIVALGPGEELRLELWPLRPGELPRLPEPKTASLPRDPAAAPPQVVSTAGAVLAIDTLRGARSLAVFTPGDERIDARVLPLPDELGGQLVAATIDGATAFLLDETSLKRVDVGGAAPKVLTSFNFSDYYSVVDVDPGGEILAARRQSDPLRDQVELLDAQTGALIPGADALKALRPNLAAFAPAGRRLALGNEAGTLALAEIGPDRRVTQLRELKRHREAIAALSFSADGSTLVSADWAGRLIAWRGLVDDAQTVVVEVPEDLWQVGTSRAGDTLWALDRHGVLRYWTLFSPDALRREIERRSTYCLDPREWIDLVGVEPDEAAETAARACRQVEREHPGS